MNKINKTLLGILSCFTISLPNLAQADTNDITIDNQNKTEITIKLKTANDTVLCVQRDIPAQSSQSWNLNGSPCANEKMYVVHAYGAIIKTGEGKVCSISKGGVVTVIHAPFNNIAISCS